MRKSISIRGAILAYTILFIFGIALFITLFLSWRLGELTGDMHKRDLAATVATIEGFIEDELRFRQRAATGYATFPALTQGVLNPADHESDIISFLGVLSAQDSNEGTYTLLDFTGAMIHSTEIDWALGTAQSTRVAEVLADQGLSRVYLYSKAGMALVELIVPICPGGRRAGEPAEGVLIYQFPLSKVVGDLSLMRGSDIALRLNSLDGTPVWEVGDWRSDMGIQQTDRFEEFDMEVQVQFDDSITNDLRHRAFVDTLLLLLLPTLFVFGLAVYTANHLLGSPLRKLRQASEAMGANQEAGLDLPDIVLPRASLTELQEVNDAFREMREQIHQRDQRLIRSNEELERFAYVAAHDLREPVRTISNMLGLLKEESGQDLSPDLLGYVDMACTRANRMQGMLADLLALSRLHVELEWESVKLETVVADVTADLDSRIVEAGALITVEALPVVIGSPNLLRLLFQNLLENGMKFVDEGTKPEIVIQGEKTSTGALIRVRDNGIGIKPQYISKIFDVFSRLHSREEYAGSGIGLSMVRRIVELHHGKVDVKSQPGEGTTFEIELPTGRRLLADT